MTHFKLSIENNNMTQMGFFVSTNRYKYEYTNKYIL